MSLVNIQTYKKSLSDLNLRMLTKVLPNGLFKKRPSDGQKQSQRLIKDKSKDDDIYDAGIARNSFEGIIAQQNMNKGGTINNSQKQVVVNSSQLLYEGSRRVKRKEGSPMADVDNLGIIMLESNADSNHQVTSGFMIDVNLRQFNTNTSMNSAEDIENYDPEEGHTSSARRKIVHFS